MIGRRNSSVSLLISPISWISFCRSSEKFFKESSTWFPMRFNFFRQVFRFCDIAIYDFGHSCSHSKLKFKFWKQIILNAD